MVRINVDGDETFLSVWYQSITSAGALIDQRETQTTSSASKQVHGKEKNILNILLEVIFSYQNQSLLIMAKSFIDQGT